MGTYNRNLETGKLHLNFTKEEYQALSQEVRKDIKSYFLFSRTYSAWVSKAKDMLSTPKRIAQKAGLTEGESIGEYKAFEERLLEKSEKAENRAERFEALSTKFEEQSTNTFNRAFDMVQVIPAGQPILVGHHSEKAHRGLLNKHDNTMRKGFELEKKAEYYADRASSSKVYGDTSRLKDVAYLGTRIKENKAIINRIERNYKPENLTDINTDIGRYYLETKDKFEFFTRTLKELENEGVILFNKENLKGKTHIKARYGWEEIVKLNPTTVSVKSGYSWVNKIAYSEIKEARTISKAPEEKVSEKVIIEVTV